jgi:hypothetical protein
LNLRAEPYLATLLAGPNAPIDLRGHGPERFRRLMQYGVSALPPLHQHSPGELAAASWLAETWSQHKALDGSPERVLAVDFDALLSDLPVHIERIVKHLGLPHEPAFLAGVAKSPSLTRYAKAPEHAYSPELRARILSQARAQHAVEIRRGLAWLERFAAVDPGVAAVCARGAV